MTSTTARTTLLFCFLAALCEGFDVQTAGVAAAGISREFKPTPEQLGLFFSGGNAGLLFGAVVGGRLADLLGRKAILVGSIAVFGFFSLATASAFNIESLIALRVLTGVGLGGAMPNLIALAAESGRSGSRNASIALTFIGLPTGGALASLVIFFLPLEHWRWVFIVGGAAPVSIAIAMTMLLRSASSARAPSPHGDPAYFASAVREVFGRGRATRSALLWLGFFLVQLTFQLLLNWLPLLMQARGLSKNEASFAQVCFNLGGVAQALLVGVLLDKPARRVSVVAACMILPIALLLLAVSPARSDIVIALTLFLGVISALQLILYGAADAIYPPTARGTGIGAAIGIGRLGAIAGPAFAALLLGAGRTPEQVLTGVLPVVVLCAVCVAFLGSTAGRSAH